MQGLPSFCSSRTCMQKQARCIRSVGMRRGTPCVPHLTHTSSPTRRSDLRDQPKKKKAATHGGSCWLLRKDRSRERTMPGAHPPPIHRVVCRVRPPPLGSCMGDKKGGNGGGRFPRVFGRGQAAGKAVWGVTSGAAGSSGRGASSFTHLFRAFLLFSPKAQLG